MILINHEEYSPSLFPDGTLNMTKFDYQIRDKVVLTWKFENLAEQVILQTLTRYLQDVRCAAVTLKLPYIPNARIDIVKNPFTEINTLKYFCAFINDLNFAKVYVMDAHSLVATTLLDRVQDISCKTPVREVVKAMDIDFFFFPDGSTFKRYSEYLNACPALYGEKQCDQKTGRIIDYTIKNPKSIAKPYINSGASILIINDVYSDDSTLVHAVNALTALGFGKVYLYITHCENSILKGKLPALEPLLHIFTTDSIYTGNHPKITVI